MSSGDKKIVCDEEPFVTSVPYPSSVGGAREKVGVVIEVLFHAHYGEPPLSVPVNVDQSLEMINISFNPFIRQWSVHRDEDEEEREDKLKKGGEEGEKRGEE